MPATQRGVASTATVVMSNSWVCAAGDGLVGRPSSVRVAVQGAAHCAVTPAGSGWCHHAWPMAWQQMKWLGWLLLLLSNIRYRALQVLWTNSSVTWCDGRLN